MEVCSTPATNSKKRMPSGSPDAVKTKTDTEDSYDEAIDNLEEEEGKANWRQYQLRKPKNSPEKKMTKKAKRLAKAKAGKAGKTSKLDVVPDTTNNQPRPDVPPDVQLPLTVGETVPNLVVLRAATAVEGEDPVHSRKTVTPHDPPQILQVTNAASSDSSRIPATEVVPVIKVVNNSHAAKKLYSELAAEPGTGPESDVSKFVNTSVTTVTKPPVFKTPAPEGPYRDEVVVEVLTLNGVPYAGTVTPVEARKMIFEGALGLNQSNLASITIGFNKGRVITFKYDLAGWLMCQESCN